MTSTGTRAERRAGWLFSLPALLAISLFFVLPTVASLALSLTDFDIYALADIGNLRFVGLANYSALVGDPLFWTALGNTLCFVALGVPLVLAVSLFAAILVNERTVAWRPVWRVAFFAPYVATLVATAVVWKYLFNTRYGLANYALGGLGLPPVDWLGEELEHGNHGQNRNQPDGRRDCRQGDVAKPRPPAGSVDPRGFLQLARHRLQRGEEDQHGVTEALPSHE